MKAILQQIWAPNQLHPSLPATTWEENEHWQSHRLSQATFNLSCWPLTSLQQSKSSNCTYSFKYTMGWENIFVGMYTITDILYHPQDVCLCAGCDLKDPAGLWSAEAVWLGCSQTQSQDAVACHSRRDRCTADLWTVLSAKHTQFELWVHQLAPQQRERVSTKYVGLTSNPYLSSTNQQRFDIISRSWHLVFFDALWLKNMTAALIYKQFEKLYELHLWSSDITVMRYFW